MATHSSILTWEIHDQRNLSDYSPWGRKDSDTTEHLRVHTHTHTHTHTHSSLSKTAFEKKDTPLLQSLPGVI